MKRKTVAMPWKIEGRGRLTPLRAAPGRALPVPALQN
jgi:hypothetical protein